MPGSDNKTLARRIAKRFDSPFLRHYAYWKIRLDPVYQAVAEELAAAPPLPLLDLGCGIGLLAAYLRESGFAGDILGIDLDARKIAAARQCACALDARSAFDCRDLLGIESPVRGHVGMLDVLQYLSAEMQQQILARAASLLDPQYGLLIVRSGIEDSSWRFRITHGIDVFARAIHWMKTPPVVYPTRETFATALAGGGLGIEFRPLWGGTPFNNYLIVARKR